MNNDNLLSEYKMNYYWKYWEAYQDAIYELMEKIFNKKRITDFERSFYTTISSMLSHYADLSPKQIAIIEKDMKFYNIKIPKEEDFRLSLSIHVNIDLDSQKFNGKVKINDFLLLLSKRIDFNKMYKKEFLRNNHSIFHKKI